MMALEYRAYASADLDDCLEVFRSNIPRFFRDHEESQFVEFLTGGDGVYGVVLLDRHLVGCGGFGLQRGSPTADLCWGMIHSAHHRKHLGEYLLLARLHAIAATTDATAVRLGTSQHTAGFFRRYGFEIQATIPDGIASGLDDVEMRLELTADAKHRITARWEDFAP